MDRKGHSHCCGHFTAMFCHGYSHCYATQCSSPCFAWLQSALLCPPIDVQLLPAAAQNGPVFDQCSDVGSTLRSTCSDQRKHLVVEADAYLRTKAGSLPPPVKAYLRTKVEAWGGLHSVRVWKAELQNSLHGHYMMPNFLLCPNRIRSCPISTCKMDMTDHKKAS